MPPNLKVKLKPINPFGKRGQFIVRVSLKMTERSDVKKREAKLRVKIFLIWIFDAKLRFALLP